MNILDFTSYQQYQDILYVFKIAQYIYKGVFTTLLYSVLAAVFGLILGTILAIFRYSNNKILLNSVKIYISVVRGTPFLLQLFFIEGFWNYLFLAFFSDSHYSGRYY